MGDVPYMTIELRRGPTGYWQGRADFTSGRWHDTPWSNIRPLLDVQEDLYLLQPYYRTTYRPETEGQCDA